MKKLELKIIILFISISNIICSQTVLQLHKKNRTIKISKTDECFIHLVPDIIDGKIVKRQVYIGKLLNFTDSVITLSAGFYNTGTKKNNEKFVYDYQILPSETIIKINIRNINSIQIEKKWYSIPMVIGISSLVSAIIVSPIISTNFKEKSFDTEKFMRAGGYSLLTSVVGLTITYKLYNNDHYLNLPTKKKKQRLWNVKV